MSARHVLILVLVLLVGSSVSHAAAPFVFHRLLPTNTSNPNSQYHARILNLTDWLIVKDNSLNLVQDYNITIYRNGAINRTFKGPTAKWTFDYDNASVMDMAVKNLDIKGTRVLAHHGLAPLQVHFNYTPVSNYTAVLLNNANQCSDGNGATYCDPNGQNIWAEYYFQVPRPRYYINSTLYGNSWEYTSQIILLTQRNGLTTMSINVSCWDGDSYGYQTPSGVTGTKANVSEYLYTANGCFNTNPAYIRLKIKSGSGTDEARLFEIYLRTKRNYYFDNLLVYLPFEEITTKNTTSWDVRRRNARLNNTIYVNASNCHKGKCVSFDGSGNDYINLSRGSGLDDLSLFTISSWIYPESCDNNARIISKGTGAETFSLTITKYNATNCNLTTTTDMTGTDVLFKSKADIRLREWQHVTVVFNNATKASKIFKNGNEIQYSAQQRGDGSKVTDVARIWRIGNVFDGTATFNGSIDELYIFNTTISNNTIRLLVNDSCRNKGYCYTILGNGTYLNLTSDAKLDKLTNFSISVWFRAFSTGGNGLGKILERMNSTGHIFVQLGLREQSGTTAKIQAYVYGTDYAQLYTTPYSVINGSWHHLVYAYNTSGAKTGIIYLDGKPATYSTYDTGGTRSDDSSAYWVLGNDFKLFDRQFNGSIDDFAIYNRSLTLAEVQTIYTGVYNFTNLRNGTYYARTWITNTTKAPQVNNSPKLHVYDTNLTIEAIDDLGNVITSFSVNTTNKNNSERRYGKTTTGKIRFNVSMGNTNFTINATTYARQSIKLPIYNWSHLIVLSFAPMLNFTLWNEITNTPFNPVNTSRAYLWVDNQSTPYNLKTRPWQDISRGNTTYLRVELGWHGNTIIVHRYINAKYVNVAQRPFKVCASYNQTFYEQIITSAYYNTKVSIQNANVPCYVLHDGTRFAYQNQYSIRAWTINENYNVYEILDDNVFSYLANFDGGQAVYVDLDTLRYNREVVTGTILGDALSIGKLQTADGSDSQTMRITYQNINDRPTIMNLTITRADTGEQLFFYNTMLNKSNWSVNWNYATYNVTNTTPLKATLRYVASGVGRNIIRIFTITNQTAGFNPAVAFVISMFLVIFGLTMTAARYAFSYFGIFVMLGAIAVLAFAPQLWYVIFLEAIEIVILVFVGLSMWYQNYQTVN